MHIEKSNSKPDFLLGHNLGKYNALFVAKAFDFNTELKLIKKRGDIVEKVHVGGTASVIGIDANECGRI